MRRLTASKCKWYVKGLTGMIMSKLTTASKNVSNFEPSTVRTGGFDLLSVLPSMVMVVVPFDVSVELLASVGIASKCCNN